MRFFLQIKAWQLFVLLFFLPFIINGFIAGVFGGPNPGANKALHTASLLLPMVSIYLVWLWAAGKILYLKSPRQEAVGHYGLFKISIIYSFVYNAYSIIFVLPLLLENPQFQLEESSSTLLRVVDVLSTFAWFYSIYFVSRALVVYEAISDEQARFFGILKLVLCFAFYPLGLWFAQPRINKAVQSEDKKQFSVEM